MQGTKRPWVGRRLYLFFAGHGIAPGSDDDLEEAALLMANVFEGSFGDHIVGRRWLNWFYRAGYFQELALFMDCCRDVLVRVPLTPPHLDRIIDTKVSATSRRLLAFATKWASKSRERPMPEFGGQVRGVFTVSLMKGLRGAAAAPDGRVTADSLRDYLYSLETVPGGGATGQDLPPPDIEVLGKGNEFVLATFAAPDVPRYPVMIHLPAALAGRTVQIIDGDETVLASVVADPPEWRLELKRGFYQVVTAGGGPEETFPVKGTGDVHVHL